jgi:hypothetical protein
MNLYALSYFSAITLLSINCTSQRISDRTNNKTCYMNQCIDKKDSIYISFYNNCHQPIHSRVDTLESIYPYILIDSTKIFLTSIYDSDYTIIIDSSSKYLNNKAFNYMPFGASMPAIVNLYYIIDTSGNQAYKGGNIEYGNINYSYKTTINAINTIQVTFQPLKINDTSVYALRKIMLLLDEIRSLE